MAATAEPFDIVFFGGLGLGSIEILRPGTTKELGQEAQIAFRRLLQRASRAGKVVKREVKTIATLTGLPKLTTAGRFGRRVKLARIITVSATAKIATLPVLPIEVALIIIGQTDPGERLFKEIKRQVLKIGSDDPQESLEGILALDLLVLGTGLTAVGLAGLAGAGVGGALAIGGGILLEVALA